MHKIDLWVVRAKELPDGTIELRDSKPCSNCLSVLKKMGINRIWYSTGDGKVICEKTAKMTTTHLSIYNKKCGSSNIRISF